MIKTIHDDLFDVANPDPSMINLDVLAYGLANETRYGGQYHGNFLYSVAYHSYLCYFFFSISEEGEEMKEEEPELFKRRSKQLMLHDASEGLGLKDIPTYIKQLIGTPYTDLEDKVMAAVWERFGMAEPNAEDRDFIKKWDHMLYVWERGQLTPQVTLDEEFQDIDISGLKTGAVHLRLGHYQQRNVWLGTAKILGLS